VTPIAVFLRVHYFFYYSIRTKGIKMPNENAYT
jgi:hypothetical protein